MTRIEEIKLINSKIRTKMNIKCCTKFVCITANTTKNNKQTKLEVVVPSNLACKITLKI